MYWETIERMFASPNQCNYFILQNEKAAVWQRQNGHYACKNRSTNST